MHESNKKRSSFSGKIGFVLSAAGASVGLGNIWRFPYLAAKYGGGIFLLIYIILALTFGYTMIVAETSLGRMTKKSPVGAYKTFGKSKWLSAGGWLNAIIPVLTVIGLGFGNLLGGMVLVETIFNWPGVGQFAYQSVMSTDYPSIIGVALLIALNYMVINTIVDILYGIIDPRVRCS